MTGKPKDEFKNYFKSETHLKIFDIVFTETFNGAAKMVTDGFGEDIDKPNGLFRAMSKMQAYAAASAHFYRTAGLTKQGAAYFRGLADQIESGPALADMAPEVPPATKPKTRAKRK